MWHTLESSLIRGGQMLRNCSGMFLEGKGSEMRWCCDGVLQLDGCLIDALIGAMPLFGLCVPTDKSILL